MTMTRKFVSAFAMAALCALGSTACSQEDEGQWVELPGGRMVYATPGDPQDTERLIYRIDHDRYFTMMTTKADVRCAQDGVTWYYDTKRKIKSEIGSTGSHQGQIFAMDPQQYLVMPVASGNLQNNARLYFSMDYGRSWRDINFIDPKAGLVVKDDVLVYLDGGDGEDFLRAEAWGFAQLVVEKESADESPTPNFFRFENDLWVRVPSKWDQEIYRIEIDIGKLIEVAPPSGWRNVRCDPMPTKPTQP